MEKFLSDYLLIERESHMETPMYQESLRKSYYDMCEQKELDVALQVILDLKHGVNARNRYNIGYYFLAFEELIKKDPGYVFTNNLPELIGAMMNVMCTRCPKSRSGPMRKKLNQT